MNKYRLYLSGPISNGDTLSHAKQRANVVHALGVARELQEEGIWVHVPHLTFLFNVYGCPRAYKDMLEDDRPMVEYCDGLLRLPGESAGADLEVKWASEADKSVFYSIDTLKSFHNTWRQAHE